MSSIRKLAKQTVLYGLTYFSARLLSFLLVPYYTRILTPENFGIYSILYAYIPFLTVLYPYGMETGYFYFANKEKDKEGIVGGTAFSSLLFSSLFFSVLVIACASLLASLIDHQHRTIYIVYVALILAFDNIAVIPFAYLRKHDRSMRFASLKAFNTVLFICFNLFFLSFCQYISTHYHTGTLHGLVTKIYDPGEPVKYILLSNVFTSAVILLLLLPEMRKIKIVWNKEIWLKMLRYSWPLLIMGFAGVINETFDRSLLKMRLTVPFGADPDVFKNSQIGIYSACYKISIFMTLAIQSFRFAAEPFFFKQMRETNSRDMYATVLKYFSFVTSFIFLGVLLFMPVIIKILGKNFRGAEDIVPILLLANLCLGMFLYLSQWYKQTEKVLYGAMVSIGGAVITLLINYIFIPQYGFMASAWATLAAYGSMAVASYILGQRHFPVKYDILRIGFYIWFALVLWALSMFTIQDFLGGWNILAYFFNICLCGLYVLAFLMLERPSFVRRVPVIGKMKRFQKAG